ncbi:hypothetical protein [Escherichia coli]|nr:hypothetical protein [Escherichia coli]
MSKLIISGNPGMFLRDIGAEYQEAAKNFMQFTYRKLKNQSIPLSTPYAT